MQRASVYEVTKGLLIHPDRRVEDGYWVAVGPYATLRQPVVAEALGLAVLQALHQFWC